MHVYQEVFFPHVENQAVRAIDLSTQVILSQTDVVKPRAVDINDNVQLSDEVREQCNIAEERVREARPLEQVIEEFISLLQTRLDCSDPADFQLVTDGQLHLRQVLHPESVRHQLVLPSSLFSFFDLRKEFARFYNADSVPNTVADMLNYLSLDADNSAEFISRQLQNMASIVCRMLNDGHKFTQPEVVLQRLEPGICSKGDTIESGCVARARGLPWQSSDQDIAEFFRGLNIVKGGVALCLTGMGRRNGEALIRFESAEHRDMALRRHRHHIGQRYIEVYRATGEDFVNVAGGNNDEAQAFLSRGGQVIVRMRGLPYDCTAKQIIDFFGQNDPPIQVLTDSDEGIMFVKKPDGRATGDAFVLFASEEAADRALAKHRETIGARYIELFRSSTAEVQQVLNRTMDTHNRNAQFIIQLQQQQQQQQQQQTGPQMPSPTSANSPLLANISQVPLLPPPLLQSQTASLGSRKDCIRLRGLPYEAQVEHILDFLGEYAKNIIYHGVHMIYNAQGQPSGEAFIQMDSEQSAFICAAHRHHRYLVINKKQRYIEVFQCSLEDMLPVLQGLQVQQSSSPVGGLTTPRPGLGGLPIPRWPSEISPFGAAATTTGVASQFSSLAGLPAGLFYPSPGAPVTANAFSTRSAAPGAASIPSPRVSPTSPLAPLSPITSLSPISPLAFMPPSISSITSMASLTPMPSISSPLAPILLPAHAAHAAHYAPAGSYPAVAAATVHQAQQAQALRLMPQHDAYVGLYTSTAQC
ncbi:RNA-binding protein fusilli-like isoform X2 [Varroa destructor]|uniref:RRM domain-containing protein n=1 Tax=Varroa destructor TaxID=109461 RepID=A0A7M7JST4_VARDE|nr:RNA-binding protein fusilli-like isoform X2 [Varroa destructor]